MLKLQRLSFFWNLFLCPLDYLCCRSQQSSRRIYVALKVYYINLIICWTIWFQIVVLGSWITPQIYKESFWTLSILQLRSVSWGVYLAPGSKVSKVFPSHQSQRIIVQILISNTLPACVLFCQLLLLAVGLSCKRSRFLLKQNLCIDFNFIAFSSRSLYAIFYHSYLWNTRRWCEREDHIGILLNICGLTETVNLNIAQDSWGKFNCRNNSKWTTTTTKVEKERKEINNQREREIEPWNNETISVILSNVLSALNRLVSHCLFILFYKKFCWLKTLLPT